MNVGHKHLKEWSAALHGRSSFFIFLLLLFWTSPWSSTGAWVRAVVLTLLDWSCPCPGACLTAEGRRSGNTTTWNQIPRLRIRLLALLALQSDSCSIGWVSALAQGRSGGGGVGTGLQQDEFELLKCVLSWASLRLYQARIRAGDHRCTWAKQTMTLGYGTGFLRASAALHI